MIKLVTLVVSPDPDPGLKPESPHCTFHNVSVPPGLHVTVAESVDTFETCSESGCGQDGIALTWKLSTITSLASGSSTIPSVPQKANSTMPE